MLLDPPCSFLHIDVMTEIQQLVTRFDALAEKTGASASTLSRKLFGNGTRIDEIRAGGSVTMTTFARVVAALDELEKGAA